MVLDTTQIIVLNWFYNCYTKGESANFNGSIQHFGEVMKIRDPMTVIKSLLDMGFINVHKTKMEVTITKAGILQYESMKKKNLDK
jgi:hypothetical protein